MSFRICGIQHLFPELWPLKFYDNGNVHFNMSWYRPSENEQLFHNRSKTVGGYDSCPPWSPLILSLVFLGRHLDGKFRVGTRSRSTSGECSYERKAVTRQQDTWLADRETTAGKLGKVSTREKTGNKVSSSTFILTLQTCPRLFHPRSSKEQTLSNTSKKCFRENADGEKSLILQLRPNKVQQGHWAVCEPMSPSELPGISWEQTCLCALLPTAISWEQPMGSIAPVQTRVGFQSIGTGLPVSYAPCH